MERLSPAGAVLYSNCRARDVYCSLLLYIGTEKEDLSEKAWDIQDTYFSGPHGERFSGRSSGSFFLRVKKRVVLRRIVVLYGV